MGSQVPMETTSIVEPDPIYTFKLMGGGRVHDCGNGLACQPNLLTCH